MSDSRIGVITEPITPRGVVAFAFYRAGWLWLFQFLVAGLVAAAVLTFFNTNFIPPVVQAIQGLGGRGEIYCGELRWAGPAPVVLAEQHFLALDFDLNHSGHFHCTSDVQVEFGRDSIRAFSLLGYTDFYYPYNPPTQIIPVSREALEPLWGAWLAEIQGLLVAGVVAGLLLLWLALGTLYWLPVWVTGWLTRRDLSLGAAWRLAGAAQLPGGLVLALAFVFYAYGVLDLVGFAVLVGVHLLVPWLYLVTGFFFLPRRPNKSSKVNPFGC